MRWAVGFSLAAALACGTTAGQGGVGKDGTAASDDGVSDVAVVDASEPDTTEEDTAEPDAVVEDASQPDTVAEDSSEPDVAAEDTPEPDVATDDASAPDAAVEDTSAPDVAVEDVPDVPPCVPACEAKACGADGCGGLCGTCKGAQSCMAGACACPAGTCGDTCTTCDAGFVCDEGVCVEQEPIVIVGACTNASDVAIIENASSDAVAKAANCGVGCIGKADLVACAVPCVESDTGLSTASATCFAMAIDCTISKCLGQCVADPQGAVCTSCQAQAGCTGEFETCSGVKLP